MIPAVEPLTSRVRLVSKLRAVSAEAFQFVVQSFGADSKNLRGAGLVAGGELDGARDHLFLDVVERSAERDLDKATVAAATSRAEIVGQVSLTDSAALAHNQSALDYVAQLAYVARPWMRLQRLHAFLVNPGHILLVLLRIMFDEHLRELRQIVDTLAQGRQHDRENV